MEEHDICYVYEKPLQLAGITVHPDFTIMRRFDNKIFYWEHCGLDDEEYLRKHYQKIERYREHGILEGENLLVTYEEDITRGRIDSIIMKMLK